MARPGQQEDQSLMPQPGEAPASEQVRQPRQQELRQERASDPYARSATGHVDFNRYFDANAATANRSAKQAGDKVQTAADKAKNALSQQYGAFGQAVMNATRAGAQGDGSYEGPTGFNPSEALTRQYEDAIGQRNALGSTGGVGALMGPGTGWFGAGLTERAGANRFADLQRRYSTMDSALMGAAARGTQEAARGAQQARAGADALRASTVRSEADIEAERLAQMRDEQAEQAYYESLQQNDVYPPYEEDR